VFIVIHCTKKVTLDWLYCLFLSKFHKVFSKDSYLTIITYLQLTSRPSCGREVIAIVADETYVNVGLVSACWLWTVMQQRILYDCRRHFSDVL